MIRTRRSGLVAAATALFLLSIAILISGTPAVTAGVTAQNSALQIGEAALQLWPEYDDPGVLVIWSGTFTGTASFPQKVAFPIPAGARNVQATYRDASGSLINRDFEVKDGQITYELPTPNFHLEYYFDRQPGGNDRDIPFALKLAYPVETLQLTVQEPARATGFTMTPREDTSVKREDGLTYHSLRLKNVAAGQQVDLGITYQKSDSGLSQPQLQVTQSSPSPAGGQSGTASNWLPFLLIGIGVAALVFVLVIWLLQQRKTAPVPPQPARGRAEFVPGQRPPARPTGAGASVRTSGGPGAVFCTQCGKSLRPDDRFCSQCGTPRRN